MWTSLLDVKDILKKITIDPKKKIIIIKFIKF